MPISPSSCCDEQETAHSSNSRVTSPLSQQTRAVERHDDPNAMLLVMASAREGARLVESRSRNVGQTEERKNDDHITSTTTVSSERALCGGAAAAGSVMLSPNKTNESASPDSSSASSRATSLLPTFSTLTTSSTHQESNHHRSLSSDLIHETIGAAAFASMGEQPSRQSEHNSNESNNNNSDSEQDDNRNSKNKNTMSADKLVPSKKPRRKRTPQVKRGETAGRWTQPEHQAFLEGLKDCGREWKTVALRIPTRTSAQIRSHAQKYFSKIQRDHETSFLNEGSSSVSAAGGGCATAAVPTGDGRSLAPNVQRNVERILSNPGAAQQEVENALEALRERYRQLQLRLEQRQEQRRSGIGSSRRTDHHPHVPDGSSSSRKRSLADVIPTFTPSHHVHHDDLSSVCSNSISASVASMGNDELIALHVLGGSLPRGDSNQDLERMVVHASHPSSDVSVASSTASAHNDQDQRMMEPLEENHCSNSNNLSPDKDDEDPLPKRPRPN